MTNPLSLEKKPEGKKREYVKRFLLAEDDYKKVEKAFEKFHKKRGVK